MKARAKAVSAKAAKARKPARRGHGAREGLRGSMSSDPEVIAGRRDRDTIPHTGREGFGDGQEMSHSKTLRR